MKIMNQNRVEAAEGQRGRGADKICASVLCPFTPFLLFCLAALLSTLAPVASAQTFNIQPAQRSEISGIATNAWVAPGTTNGTALKSVLVGNVSAFDYWIFVFDSATNQLDNTSTNRAAWKVSAGTVMYWDPPDGERFARGVAIAQSTTFPTLTNASAANSALVVTVKHTP